MVYNLVDKINSLEERLTKLEGELTEANEKITQLESILDARRVADKLLRYLNQNQFTPPELYVTWQSVQRAAYDYELQEQRRNGEING